MIKKFSIATFVALFVLFLPLQQFQAQASTTVKVTAKKFKYNSQEYVQLTGGNKPATTAINKVLKSHAVQADKFNKENKKNNGWYQTNVKVKFNQNEQISVGYTDTLNIGGATNTKVDTYYNYNLRTGKEIKLNSIVKTQTQKDNLIEAVSTGLKVQIMKKGLDIYEESITYPPLADAQFYLNSNGIVIHFNRYAVAIESSVEIPISMTTINKTKTPLATKKLTEPLQFKLGEQAKNELQKGIIPGFEGIMLGMSKKNLLDRFSTSPNNTFFYMGSDYITFSKNDIRFGFVQIEPDTLDHVFIGKEAFSYKNISEVEGALGKGKAEMYKDVDETTSTRNYTFGNTNLVFFLDKKDNIEYIQINHK